MRPRGRASSFALAMSAMAGMTGCLTSSIAGDVGRVRDLSRIGYVARVADVDVDPAAAEDARRILERPLDADAAVRVALLNNRDLRATLREMGIARGRLMQAGLLPNPVVEVELLPERNTQVEVRVEYDLKDAVLAPIRARAAEPELEAARYRAAAAVVDLGYRVRSAFHRLQSAGQRVAVAQRVLDGYAAARDAARAMLDAGNVAELDLAGQEAAYERARVTVAQLELEAATERERLQRLMGTYGNDAAWRVSGELPPVPEATSFPPDLEARVLGASLDLSETRQRLVGLARRTGLVRTEGWLPELVVHAHGLQGSPEAAAGGASERGLRLGAGVSVGVPLFDRRQGTAAALDAEFDARMERYHGMAVDLRSAAREARSRVSSAHARARHYQEIIVPAQGRVTAQTLLQYNAMQVGIFQLLQARREELDVQLAYVETLREYWDAAAEMDALLAGRRVMPDGRAASSSTGSSSELARGH